MDPTPRDPWPGSTLDYRAAGADRHPPQKVVVRVVAGLAGIVVGAMPVSMWWDGISPFRRDYGPAAWFALLSAVFLELVALGLLPARRRRG